MIVFPAPWRIGKSIDAGFPVQKLLSYEKVDIKIN